MTEWPNLYFIGGMRCGSTTLYLLLSQHPEIFMSSVKEPMFWSAENLRREGQDADAAFSGKYITEHAFLSLFSEAGEARWRGEASHYLYHGNVAGLLRNEVPEARIIVSLRNPTDRIFSEYLYWSRSKSFKGTFPDFLSQHGVKWSLDCGIYEAPTGSRLPKGLQAEKISTWFDTFGSKRVHVVFFEDLEEKPVTVAQDIYRWLEVDGAFTPQIVHTQKGGVPVKGGLMRVLNFPKRRIKRFVPRLIREKIRARIYDKILERPVLDPNMRAMLDAYYAEDVARLSQMTGRDLSHWSSWAG